MLLHNVFHLEYAIEMVKRTGQIENCQY